MTAVVLAACSTSPADRVPPPATPSTSPSPTPTPSRTVTRPLLPAAAAQPTRDGAAAFIRYFFETYDYAYAYATLDTEPFRAASEAECEFCLKVLKLLEDLRADGGSMTGGETTVLSTLVSPGNADTGLLVVTRYRQEASQIIDAGGATADTDAAIESTCQLVLGWRSSGWQVFALAKVS